MPVHRCWHFVPRKVSAWKRILHEGTFVLTSIIRILALKRPDVYIVVSPPLLLGAAAWLAGTIQRAPFVFYVKDLQPDAAVGLGMLKTGWFTRALYWLEAFAYKHAARVAGISTEMLDVLPGNPKQLAATLSTLAQDRQRLRSWDEAGRNYVERFEQRRLLERFTAELAALAG